MGAPAAAPRARIVARVWADLEHVSQQWAGADALAEQYPQGNARERLAVGQLIQWDAATRGVPATPPPPANAGGEEKADEKHARSYC